MIRKSAPSRALALLNAACVLLAPAAPVRVRAASVNSYDWTVRDGRLRMTVGATLPLAAAAQAQDLSKRGGTPGKIILAID